MKNFYKDPDAVLDYEVSWAGWLGDDTIVDSEWIVPDWVAPDGLVRDSESFTDTTATIWLSGGVEGTRYELTNRITTAGGRTDDRSISIKVQER